MTSQASVRSDGVLRDSPDFSLVLGGPLFQILRRVHLTDDALALLRQRIIVISVHDHAVANHRAPEQFDSGVLLC